MKNKPDSFIIIASTVAVFVFMTMVIFHRVSQAPNGSRKIRYKDSLTNTITDEQTGMVYHCTAIDNGWIAKKDGREIRFEEMDGKYYMFENGVFIKSKEITKEK